MRQRKYIALTSSILKEGNYNRFLTASQRLFDRSKTSGMEREEEKRFLNLFWALPSN